MQNVLSAEDLASRLGWVPDTPDARDYNLRSFELVPLTLPASVDLTDGATPPYDQGALGSCTGNATAVLFRFTDRKQGGLNLDPSRLQIYYDARLRRGWQATDSGAMIRDAVASVHDKGAVPEASWPYDVSRFAVAPPAEAYAKAEKSVAYMRVSQNQTDMKACLAAGYPFVIGFTVYENFRQVGSDGLAEMPSGRVLGGHAVTVVGYDDSTQRWRVMNSWGPDWGLHGFFTIPYQYFTNSNLSDDLWTIRQVQEMPAPQPVGPPTITTVRFKKEIKLVVWGTFDEAAVLYVDGRESDAGAHGERFVTRQHLDPGSHSVKVVNPDGQSATQTFEV